MSPFELWERYCRYACTVPDIGLELDVSRIDFDDAFLSSMEAPMEKALDAMAALEAGAKVNIDEDRQVGHYWLRAPDRAPHDSIGRGITKTVEDIHRFAKDLYSEAISPERGDGFYVVLVIGIGGSALGPQLVADALGVGDDHMLIRFLDNTDPDGIDRILLELEEVLPQTLTIVVSKSGETKETRNGMIEVAHAYKRAGLNFARHAVAVTGEGSALHEQAARERWLRTFPLWDFVGGRTSVTSAAGLLPAALQGIDIDALLEGARLCDEATRERDMRKNPAALLSLMWHRAGEGRGRRNMVVLPYHDRLALMGKYLQQLVMESIGKARDRRGRSVHQGLTVFGNKGSTDQHSFVQQLREGPDDFFVTFLDVLCDRDGSSMKVEEDVTSGDYLHAFRLGTRAALTGAGRQSITISLEELTARSLGALIALFERAVGLYAELIDVNAYHQPGVESGKKTAAAVLSLQRRVFKLLRQQPNARMTPPQIAEVLGESNEVETIHHLLRHAARNRDHGVTRTRGRTIGEDRYGAGKVSVE